MCSIFGYTGSVVELETLKKGFDETISRGPDMSRIMETGKGLLGFHRLAIMGLTPEGMQPFTRQNESGSTDYVVCNGEIYGFRAIKNDLIEKGYKFKSDSDCELLLPLWYEYGTDRKSVV